MVITLLKFSQKPFKLATWLTQAFVLHVRKTAAAAAVLVRVQAKHYSFLGIGDVQSPRAIGNYFVCCSSNFHVFAENSLGARIKVSLQ